MDKMAFPLSSSASFPAAHALTRSCAPQIPSKSISYQKGLALSVDGLKKGQGPEWYTGIEQTYAFITLPP